MTFSILMVTFLATGHGIAGLVILIPVSLSVVLLFRFGSRGVDKALDKVFMVPHGQLRVQEQFAADLKKAVRLKSEKRFSESLRLVKNLLTKDPNWAEALLLKAQILDEAYGNKEAAKYILTKIMQIKPDNIKATHSAATYLYEELCSDETPEH